MIRKISGSWFEFQHPNKAEGIYWNTACAGFTTEDWDAKVKEISDIGMEYLVLMAVALDFKAFSSTSVFPNAGLACSDPLEAVLSAGDKYGVKFFIGAGFYGDWEKLHECFADKAVIQKRQLGMEELVERYAHHKSFYGWYWPDEAFIDRYFSEIFIDYVNNCSSIARKLTPDAKILIAPYGTRVAVPDDKYVKQLDKLDVDIIAYQDEVGVRKTRVDESAVFFEGLRKAHDKVHDVAIWADVEIFEFEGEVYKSALLPASFSRVEKQLEAVSHYVDEILVYQYPGMMNKPGSAVFAGHPDSICLYSEYVKWMKRRN